MPWGKIIKALSGYYYILPDATLYEEDKLIQCRARGVFRKTGESPLVGDYVSYELSQENEGTVIEIASRKNSLIRPPIANVDQVILVFSVNEPMFNSLLLDRFLVHIEMAHIPVVICFSKSDLIEIDLIESMVQAYRNIGYKCLLTSVKSELGLKQIYSELLGKISVFAGQSGVGKSSLLNQFIENRILKTNEISNRLGRGKHTTRHVELIPIELNSWVADTPGFSQLDFIDILPEQLSDYFTEMKNYQNNCKYRGCLHDREPSCGVRAAVENGQISHIRYKHYLLFLQELKEAKQRRY